MPPTLQECCPISRLEEISPMLEHPPNWIMRIKDLKVRLRNIVKNHTGDCHTELSKLVPNSGRVDSRFTPKTLVCHDYKGGYLEDRYIQSSNKGNQYTFYHWAHIDIFVYFSHYMITIPPLCWLNAAHENGVRILGTFITEGIEGKEICKQILKDDYTIHKFAESLLKIMKLFKFDGWLLNIENIIEQSSVEKLKDFVDYLTILVHKQHTNGIVLWYDSVIETGELKWQNELNDLNRCFFERCDGIYLNYSWNLDTIRRTTLLAGHRNFDVYVGIDVFGRNTFGGGQFQSYKAAQVVRDHNLSLALFAPGWTHETLLVNHHQQFFQKFIERDTIFWNTLWPFLYTHPIGNYFKTTFYIGSDPVLYNIHGQEQQLSKIRQCSDETFKQHVPNQLLNASCKCIQYDLRGTKLKCLLTRRSLPYTNRYNHQLFTCDMDMNGWITVFFITEPVDFDSRDSSIHINLLVIDRQNDQFRLIKLNSLHETFVVNSSTMVEVNPSHDYSLLSSVRRIFSTLFIGTEASLYVYRFEMVIPCTLVEIGCTFDQGLSIYLSAFGIKNM